MNSLDRAKHFLAQKASRLALTVVPLAALAIASPPARANVVLSSGDNCVVNGSGSCATSQQSATGGNPGINWIGMTGSGAPSLVSGSGYFLGFSASGSASGSLAAGTIPVSWDFNINAATDPTVNWRVFYELLLPSGGFANFTTSGSAATGKTVEGDGSIRFPGGTVDSYIIQLTATSADPFTITIPGSATLDLNPSPVPEPSSLLMISAAGAWMILRRKKRA